MSGPNRPIRYIVQSPAPKIIGGAVVLYEQTWAVHIADEHPDIDLEHIQNTLDDPCFIQTSLTRNDTVVLTNLKDTNSYGDPLWVPVRIQTNGLNFVTSAYYKQNSNQGSILWNRGDD